MAVRYVPTAELEAEEAELKALQDRRSTIQAEIRRLETTRYTPLWEENVRLVSRIRYAQRQLAEATALLEAYRRRGWVRLRAAEREEYLWLRDTWIPRLTARIRELRETQEKVIAELWRVTAEIAPLRTELTTLESAIRRVQTRIKRKVVTELRRIELNAYVIVEAKEKYFKRKTEATAKKHGPMVYRHYPKGKFQAIYQLDCFCIPETDTALTEIDPASTIIEKLKEDASKEIEKYFRVYFTPPQFTVGVTNILLDEDLGRPPKKIQVARTVEPPIKPGMSPKEDWKETMEKYIMTQAEYNRLTAHMTDYINELKRLGKYQEAL